MREIPKGLIKKKYRKIVVQDELFAWRVGKSIPVGYGLGINIIHIDSKKEINGFFRYEFNTIPHFNLEGRASSWSNLIRKYTIVPSYIERMIKYAFGQGWSFQENFELNLTKEVPIESNWKEFKFPKLENEQVVVISYKNRTVLDIDLNEFNGDKDYHRIFTNIDEARAFSIKLSGEDPSNKFWIINNPEWAIAFVSHNSVLHFER